MTDLQITSAAPATPVRYQLLGWLGHGGMGVVELVHDSARGEAVARKRMRVDTAEARAYLAREFFAAESLRHPNIVTLYELGEEEGGVFFTMEHVRGIDLLRYCTSGAAAVATAPGAPAWEIEAGATTQASLSSDPAAGAEAPARRPRICAAEVDEARLDAALAQLIEALRFLHREGIVHRDLKPGNVLVRDDGQVKLLDFGLSVEPDLHTAVPPAAGTPPYMAPEQIRGQRCGPPTDAYAFGAMLFEIVTGRPPFIGTPPSVVRAHLEREAPRADAIRPGVPRRYAEACERLLRKDPARRAGLAEIADLLDLPGARRWLRAPSAAAALPVRPS